jgi:hypothetical protein
MPNLRPPVYSWRGSPLVLTLPPRSIIVAPDPMVRVYGAAAKSIYTINPGGGGAGFANFRMDIDEPFVANSDAPAADPRDNTGCRIPLALLTTLSGNQTVTTGQTLSGKLILGDVTMSGGTLIDCVVQGSAPANPSRPGLINGTSGTLQYVTLRPRPGALLDPNYQTTPAAGRATYKNNAHISGGPWLFERCDISLLVDGIHQSSGSSTVTVKGCLFHDKIFWDCDPAQASVAAPNQYYSHGDDIQNLAGATTWDVHGNSFQAFFDCTGVVWSGGAWGQGTASGGTYGTPSTALNRGFFHPWLPGKGTWANGFNTTGSAVWHGSHKFNWHNGVNAGSANLQFGSGGVGHSVTFEGNRFGTDGQTTSGGNPTSSGSLFLASWPSTTAVTIGPTGAGTYTDRAGAVHALPGTGATGYKVTV